MSEKSESAYGRRDIIKKTAVAGAVAWTAPMIVSSRAFAALGSPGGGPSGCEFNYVVKIDGSEEDDGKLHCPFPAGYIQLTDPVYIAKFITGTYTDKQGGSFELASTVTLLQVVGKKRSDECNVANAAAKTPFTVSPKASTSPGGKFTVGSGQSHIMVVFCSDVPLVGGIAAPAFSTPLPEPTAASALDAEVQDNEAIFEQVPAEGAIIEPPPGLATVVDPPPELATVVDPPLENTSDQLSGG